MSSASREGALSASLAALMVGRTREYRMGRDTQLVAIDGGASPVSLFVLCGDRFEGARLFRSGELSVHMIRVEGHPVSMASCTVADHQWMLARDALVARLDARVFVFELPGFFYAVVVPPDAAAPAAGGGRSSCSDRKCATLAEIFSRFCAYQDISSQQGEDEAGELNEHSNPWVRAHARLQRLKRPASPPGRWTSAVSSDRPMERAVRTSAIVKLLSRSLLAGALQPARHLTISHGGAGTSAAAASGTSGASAAALPSKSVVSDLLDAIETSRTTPCRDVRRGGGGTVWWSLNVEGVMLLLRVVQAVRGRGLPEAGGKRPRDEGNGSGSLRGGISGGGGAAAFGGGSARRWCGGRPTKLGNTVGACGSS